MMGELFSATVWSRLFVAIFLLLLAQRLRRTTQYPGVSALLLIPLILIVRDVTSVFLTHDLLFLGSDLAIVGVYLAWLNHSVNIRPVLWTYTAGAIAFLAFDGLVLFLGWPGYVSVILELIIPVAAFTVLAIVIIDIREIFVAQAAPIVRSRYTMLTLFGIALVIGMIHDYTAPFVTAVLLPMTYFGHFAVLYAYQMQREYDFDKQIRLRERYLDTLFDFMSRTRTAMEEHAPTESVLSYVVATVAEAVDAEAGTALLLGSDGMLHVQATYGYFPPPYEVPENTKTKIGAVEKYFRARPIPLGETILGEAVQRGRAVFIQRCSGDSRMSSAVGDKVTYMSSLVIAPLTSGGKPIGAVAVAHRDEQRVFSQDDFSHATVLAEYASLTLENLFNYMEILEKKQMEKEITMAADIQRGMLPEPVPRLKRIGLGAYTSAARGVSGDYYDYFAMRKSGRVALTVCDVSGKGVPASLVMVMIRTIMRLLSSTSLDAATMTRWINRGVVGSVDLGRFATFSIVAYDPRTRTLEYANAGHLPVMLYRRRTESVETLHADGLPIGIEASAKYQTHRYTLQPGDVLIMYTDGIVEAKNAHKDEFGWERLEDVVRAHHEEHAQELVDAIASRVAEFRKDAPQNDDQTLLAMKVD